MIKFHQDTTLHVVETESSTDETFKAGEYVCAEIVSQNADYCDLQFGDGAMTYNVFRPSFEVL
jgi:hypothetical protein